MADHAAINTREMTAMLAYMEKAVGAGTEQERDDILSAGIVAWGREFINVLSYAAEQHPDPWAPMMDAANARFARWLGGAKLTDRADEDERRALAALEVADLSPSLARLPVEALRRLPGDHPLRLARLDAALSRLRDHLETAEGADDVDTRLITLAALLAGATSPEQEDALVEEGEELLPRATDEASIENFRVAAGHIYSSRMIRARDAGDTAAVPALVRRARRLLDPLVDKMAKDGNGYGLTLAGIVIEMDDDADQALDRYLQALQTQLSEDKRLATLTAVLRTGVLSGRYHEVVQHARETLDGLVLRYATEPDPRRTAEHRSDLDRALANVCASCTALGDLDLLLWALEVTSSARLRHRMAIRRGRSGPRIRTLEAALWSAERGISVMPTGRDVRGEGRAAASLTVVARLREAHRSEAERHRGELATPTVAEVAARLHTHEGVVVLGAGQWGTALLLIGPPGGDEPRTEPEGDILPTSLADWAAAFASDDPPGWAYVLGAPWEYDGMPGADRRAALERAIHEADAEVGPRLADWATVHDLRRLWVVAHGVLGLLPWWAVPSLCHLDVRPAATLAMLPRARGAARLAGPTLVVGNATGDLPAADVEAGSVAARLGRRGLPTTVLSSADSTEDVVTRATAGARVLHFCGHATSDMTDSTRSALHLRPDPHWSTPTVADDFETLAAVAQWDDQGEAIRTAEVEVAGPGGHEQRALLREENLQGAVTLRHLEHSQTGTLQAVFADDRLVRLAELWSAGDMAVSGALRDLRIAVLSACQSGGGGLDLGSDELGGLPAAMMLAGVRSIVCTAWTVDDVLSALTADLFWELLCAHDDGVVDLYAVVGQVRTTLAEMPREDAVRRIDTLREAAPAGRTRFVLEAAAAGLGPGRPFARPYDWAPLFVVGEPLVTWRSS